MEKAKDSFKLIPIVNGHVFLGKDGENPKNYQEGSVGENIDIVSELDTDNLNKNFLKSTLMFTNPETIKLIQSGEKTELSTSYSNELKKAETNSYDFEVTDIVANHLALVKNGRAGSKVRVANKNIETNNNKQQEKEIMKTKNIEEKKEEVIEETNNEIIKEDKRKIIDEIGGILKDKVDEELWRTIIKKAEKLAYEGSEESKSDNEEKEEEEIGEKEDTTTNKCNNSDISAEEPKDDEGVNGDGAAANLERLYNVLKTKLENENKSIIRAYNEVKSLTGDFNFFGMSESDIYAKALKNENIEIKGNETLGELKAMFRVYNSLNRDIMSKTTMESGDNSEVSMESANNFSYLSNFSL